MTLFICDLHCLTEIPINHLFKQYVLHYDTLEFIAKIKKIITGNSAKFFQSFDINIYVFKSVFTVIAIIDILIKQQTVTPFQ